jgi:hypothetical protein
MAIVLETRIKDQADQQPSIHKNFLQYHQIISIWESQWGTIYLVATYAPSVGFKLTSGHVYKTVDKHIGTPTMGIGA